MRTRRNEGREKKHGKIGKKEEEQGAGRSRRKGEENGRKRWRSGKELVDNPQYFPHHKINVTPPAALLEVGQGGGWGWGEIGVVVGKGLGKVWGKGGTSLRWS